MARDIEYYRLQDRSHVITNLLSGAKAGIINQFFSDIIVSLLANNEKIIINDVEISEIPSYYASTASVITAAVLAIYMDPFAIVLFSSAVYEYVFNLVSSNETNTEFEFSSKDVIFDSIVIIILIYLFDPVAHNQYLRYKEKRYSNDLTHKIMERNLFQTIFFIILINTYNFVKNNNITSENNEQ